jgi:rhodanese-related sulfurtransferase
MLYNLVLLLLIRTLSIADPVSQDVYRCLPCGRDCDNKAWTKPGTCSDCHMELVKSNSITFRNIPPSAICDYISSHPQTILLDVRTPEEFSGTANPNFGTLKNAINIPIQELPNRLSELDKYKGKEILVFCSHSHRSPRASHLLTQNGFKQVVNMSGGMSQVGKVRCKK